VCEAHYRLLHSDASGIFNIGTGSTTSFLEIAQIIGKKYNATIETIPMPKELKKHYQYRTKANNKKLIDAVGEIDWTDVEEYIK